MSNKRIENEAKRVTNELIKITESKNNLDKIFHSILKKEFKNHDMNVLCLVSKFLADSKYTIKSIEPFELKKYN